MKILFLNHNFENFGTYFRCFSLAKSLSHKDNVVDLICASGSNIDFKIRCKFINPRFRIITLPRIKFHPYHTGHMLRAWLNSLAVLLKEYDILHSFAVAQPSTAMPVMVAKLLRNKPTIVDWDDIWGNGFGSYHNPLVNYILSFSEKHIPKFSDKITVVSDFLKEKALYYRFPANKVVKIINGSDVEAIKPIDKAVAREKLGFKKDELILVCVGHTYMDTLDILFEAYGRVLRKIRGVKLIMVGSWGKQDGFLRSKILDLSSNIIILGERPFSEIPYLLGCADILLLPMKDNIIEKARLPIRFGDYLASGRPIVSNAVGEIRRIILEENCGLVSSPGDLEEFAKNIIELIGNRELSETMGKKSRRVAEEKLAWDKIAEELTNVYQEVLR